VTDRLLTHTVFVTKMRTVTAPTVEPARPELQAPGPAKARRRAREYQRIAVRCGCWLEHEQATVYGTTVNLGRGGLFLRTALPICPGAPVRVTLNLPGRTTVVADGKVVRTVASSLPDLDGLSLDGAARDRPGLGVRFDRLPDGEDSLDAFLCGTLQAQRDADAGVVGG
jgi:hypothetical protein